MEPVKDSPPALQGGGLPRRAAEQKSLVLWRWCAVSLGKEALGGQPLPSLSLLWVSFNTRRTLLFPSPTCSSRACSTRQTHGQPPALVSLGLSPFCGHSSTTDLPVVETLWGQSSARCCLCAFRSSAASRLLPRDHSLVIASLSSLESHIPAPLDLCGITPGRNRPVRPTMPTVSAGKLHEI